MEDQVKKAVASQDTKLFDLKQQVERLELQIKQQLGGTVDYDANKKKKTAIKKSPERERPDSKEKLTKNQ